MLTIHHLGVSQSDRIVWLMEELGLPYKLVWHRRGEDRLMQADYLALHPAATAPVVDDDGRMLSESTAIVEYICHKYAGGRLTVGPGAPNYFDYLYWLQLNNNMMGLQFGRIGLGEQTDGWAAGLFQRRADGYARFVEQALAAHPYLAGDEFTCADIMSAYSFRPRAILGARDDMPNARAYMARIEARPAYIRAMALAGPEAQPPAGA